MRFAILFGLDPQSLDVASQLPGDETADGSFDNFADVLSISTAHLERYMSVARQMTRRATALPPSHPSIDTFEIPLHVTQEIGRATICRSDRAAASRSGMTFRPTASIDSRSACSGTIRTISRGWDGSSSSTCGSTASC